jgi:TPR repeat protein
MGDLAQAASSQETGVIEQKALALYNQKHYSDAGPLFEQACAGGGFEGCGFLGYMYQNQLGVARDYARAATAYKKACEGKNAFACSQLGYMYQYRLGVEQDYPLAATLFLKACDGGSAKSRQRVVCSPLWHLPSLDGTKPLGSPLAHRIESGKLLVCVASVWLGTPSMPQLPLCSKSRRGSTRSSWRQAESADGSNKHPAILRSAAQTAACPSQSRP